MPLHVLENKQVQLQRSVTLAEPVVFVSYCMSTQTSTMSMCHNSSPLITDRMKLVHSNYWPLKPSPLRWTERRCGLFRPPSHLVTHPKSIRKGKSLLSEKKKQDDHITARCICRVFTKASSVVILMGALRSPCSGLEAPAVLNLQRQRMEKAQQRCKQKVYMYRKRLDFHQAPW